MTTKTVIAKIERIKLINEKEGRVLLSDVVIQDKKVSFNVWVKYSTRFYNAGAKQGSVIEFNARIENINNYMEINHIRGIEVTSGTSK
jgi:hypothetical protein